MTTARHSKTVLKSTESTVNSCKFPTDRSFPSFESRTKPRCHWDATPQASIAAVKVTAWHDLTISNSFWPPSLNQPVVDLYTYFPASLCNAFRILVLEIRFRAIGALAIASPKKNCLWLVVFFAKVGYKVQGFFPQPDGSARIYLASHWVVSIFNPKVDLCLTAT